MDAVTVRLLAPVMSQTGGHWNTGEIVGFAPEIASALIARGVAERIEISKAPDRPPADKMIKGAPLKKASG